jgi:hypothetical protein
MLQRLGRHAAVECSPCVLIRLRSSRPGGWGWSCDRGVGIAGTGTVSRDNSAYPPPDPDFVTTAITERLAERVRRVRDGEAELPATAYYVLTELENEFGGGGRQSRRAAAKRLAVDSAILDKLGELTNRYDPDIGRKAKGPPAPLTDEEVEWILTAMLRLVLRTGELAGRASPSRLTMSDLPPLYSSHLRGRPSRRGRSRPDIGS